MAMEIQNNVNNYDRNHQYLRPEGIPAGGPAPIDGRQAGQQKPLQDISTKTGQRQEAPDITAPAARGKDAAPAGLLESMRPEKDLAVLSRNSGLEQLDMKKAISDMQKDSILQQYQYFVGDKPDVLVNDEDGMVLRKIAEG